jgi:hypothetical protein
MMRLFKWIGQKLGWAISLAAQATTIVIIVVCLFRGLKVALKLLDPPIWSVQVAENLPDFKEPDLTQNSTLKWDPIIRLQDFEDRKFHCTATVVSDNYAVTAGHCVVDEDGRLMKKTTFEVYDVKITDTGIQATAAGTEERGDYGLITGDFRQFKKIQMNTSVVGIESRLEHDFILCGYPYGDVLLCKEFHVKQNSYFMIRGNGILYPGMSGGPLLDKNTGEVVGVNSSVNDPGIDIAPLMGVLPHFGIRYIPLAK